MDVVLRTMQCVAMSIFCTTEVVVSLVTIKVFAFNVPGIMPRDKIERAHIGAAHARFGSTNVQVAVLAMEVST